MVAFLNGLIKLNPFPSSGTARHNPSLPNH
jgi:hypothetical protein